MALATDAFLYDAAARAALQRLWLRFIREDLGKIFVTVADDDPERIVAFGTSAFVSAELMDVILHEQTPFVAYRLLERWQGGDDPFLNENAIAEANAATGVNVLVLNNGSIPIFDAAFGHAVYAALIDGFKVAHAGLNVRTLAHELFGWFPDLVADLGIAAIRSYPPHTPGLERVPPERRPFRAFWTREEAQRHPGDLFANELFLRFSPPALSFDVGKRQVLRLALEGESDNAIAEILNVSLATVKKRWAAVYEVFEQELSATNARVLRRVNASHNDRRGPECRCHVLRYIRQHPEALQPYPLRQTVKQRSTRSERQATSNKRRV